MDYVVLDLETTGLDCAADAVIEIGAIKISDGIMGEEFSTLINPGRPIPEEILSLTGIADEMVIDSPRLGEIIGSLERFLTGAVIVGHNVGFDRSFLQSHLSGQYGWLDTIELARILLPCEAGYSLGDLTRSLSLKHENRHRALGDARATAELLLYLLNQLGQVDLPVLEILYTLSRARGDVLAQLIGEEFSARVRFFPGEKITRQQLFVPAEKNRGLFAAHFPKEKNEDYLIPAEQITRLFSPGGPMDDKIKGYEYRDQQKEMARAVAESFNQGCHLIVEAGTGTGKSLAYLLPTIIWSVRSGRKVLVSTHTINLQEQLITKDIPLAREVLEEEFHTTVIKGRSHYLCLRKWMHGMEEQNHEIQRSMMRLVLWLSRTGTGDSSELSLSKKEMMDWQRFAALRETCLGPKCRFYRGDCFVSRAKKSAELSHVVIVNHSLLLANAVAEENILPEYKYLIVDEAHHLEKVAEEQFGAAINYYETVSLLGRLKKSGSVPGLLDNLTVKLGKWGFFNEDLKKSIAHEIEEALLVAGECGQRLREFFSLTGASLFSGSAQGGSYPRTVRILPEHREQIYWSGIAGAGDNLIIKIQELVKLLVSLGHDLNLGEIEHGLEIAETNNLNMLAGTFHQIIRDLRIIIFGDEENFVSWAEYTGDNPIPVLRTAPVEVKEQLHQYLFAPKSAVVLTSATLAVGGKFDFFKENTGIELSGIPVRTMQLKSPFHFAENVLLCVASDLPDPGETTELLFTDAVSRALIKLIQASRGRTLVLFTSHFQLKQVYDRIKIPLHQEGITVYAHGVTGSRNKVLQYFRTRENSVILGANSFWEGVDVVGEALTSVIIVKLPFWPPSLPTVAARLDRYRSLHLDGFHHYSLPQAIIRFKQGFGRLIRSHADFGVICILDPRIYQKRYGKTFIASLPDLKMRVQDSDGLAAAIKEWLRRKESGS